MVEWPKKRYCVHAVVLHAPPAVLCILMKINKMVYHRQSRNGANLTSQQAKPAPGSLHVHGSFGKSWCNNLWQETVHCMDILLKTSKASIAMLEYVDNHEQRKGVPIMLVPGQLVDGAHKAEACSPHTGDTQPLLPCSKNQTSTDATLYMGPRRW